MTTIEERLAKERVLLLDGGIGTELERRGVPMHDLAWCGTANLAHGDTLTGVHADYIRAGADVVITNSFATPRYLLKAAGLGDKVREINLAAVAAAQRARDKASGGREVWIAGSISHMAPGTDPARRPDPATAAASFREQAEILARGGVDLILLEMMRVGPLALAALEAALGTGLPVWVGFSCVAGPQGRLVAGPDVAEAPDLGDLVAEVMARGGALAAVMHSDVALAAPALEVLAGRWDGPLGAYPHSGRFDVPHWDFSEVIDPEAYLTEARGWVAQGARAVGGCCGIGPEHIRALAEGLA